MDNLLDLYRRDIMISTLGSYIDDEDGVEYGLDYFKWEWLGFKQVISEEVDYTERVIGNISSEQLMILIISGWCMHVCHDKNTIDKSKLKTVCKNILNQRYNH